MISKIIRVLEFKIKNSLFPKGRIKTLHFNDIILNINELDEGGQQYDSKKSHEEISNHLYPIIEKYNSPKLFLDIGANYGFISIIASKQFPNAKLILIEPSKRLSMYILDNLKLNNITNYEFIPALCGEEEKNNVNFSINPFSSQDNRVIAPKKYWEIETTQMVSINGLLKQIDNNTSIFIKIDVQGFEEMVFKGAEEFLLRHKNWVIKTEFAPKWLSSQGSDALRLLNNLVEKYDVIELPGRTAYQTRSLDELFANPIQMNEIANFLTYIISLDKNGKGWCDLLIRPK